ncbi:MAG TPA: hypothetical protein VIJ10_10605 [Vicinamibacteria bacterium]
MDGSGAGPDPSRYPAARLFARRLEAHFAPAADAASIEALIDAGFWASLQREEGYTPEISLAFLPRLRAESPLLLAPPLPLGPRALAQLAPAVERPGIHLGVWRENGELVVWGTTRTVPVGCFVLEVVGPGLLVVKHREREDSPKFRNLAVFEGDQVKVLNRATAEAADLPVVLRALVGAEVRSTGNELAGDVVLRLAVSMRAHKRGGTLLVVPAGSDAWLESIVRPIRYAVEPPFTELAELASGPVDAEPDPIRLGRVVDALAGLTAVDGATVITDRFELLAFGVKIGRPDGRLRAERVSFSEPVEGGTPVILAPLQLGGTRHISAAQFAQDQQDAVALVASQDGRFTVFAWSAREGLVRAHRIEALLL